MFAAAALAVEDGQHIAIPRDAEGGVNVSVDDAGDAHGRDGSEVRGNSQAHREEEGGQDFWDHRREEDSAYEGG